VTRDGLWSYVRHAERAGVELVFESAAEELDARDLGRLAVHLRRIDPSWRLGDRAARELALALLEQRVAPDEVARMVGRDRTTIWRLRRELRSDPATQSGADVANRVRMESASRGGDTAVRRDAAGAGA
jgi:hypothetical protein